MADKWVVFCVHGVGDSKPADLVDAVAPQVCAVRGAALPTPDQYEMVRLPDGKDETFPLFMRRAAFGPTGVLFAELYWADLSRSKPGFVGFLISLFLLVFGIRHIADQASDQGGGAAWVLRALLLTVANLLRGPLFALYLLATAHALIYLAAEGLRPYLWMPDLRSAPASGVLFGLLGVVAVAVGLRLWWESRRRDLLSATPWYSLAAVGLAAVATAVGTLLAPVDLRAGGNPAWPEAVRWLFEKFLLKHYALGVSDTTDFYLAATVGAANLVLVVISALMLAALVPLAWGWAACPPPTRRALAAAYLAEGMQIALWVLVVTPLDWLNTCALVVHLDPATTALYWADFVHYLFVQVVFLVVIVSAGAYVWVTRVRWAGRSAPDGWDPGRPVPRLIVGPPILLAVLVCSLAFFLFTLWVVYSSVFLWPPAFFAVGVIVFLGLVPAAAGLLFWQEPVRFGQHVVADVISHFQRKGGRFPLRERIRARFQQALRRLLDAEDPSHVLIVAHSQGTIITLDALLDPEWEARLRGRAVTLATFGSPFTHIYQYYFPRQYGSLKEGEWPRLGNLVGRWVNLFRIDDYVGTNIEGPKEGWPSNVPLPVGYAQAHTSYWEETIFRRIAAELPPAGPPDEPAAAPMPAPQAPS